MADRFLIWVGAGVLAAGVSAGTLTGAGIAFADEGAADPGGTASSEASDPGGAESPPNDAGVEPQADSDEPSEVADQVPDVEVTEDPADEEAPDAVPDEVPHDEAAEEQTRGTEAVDETGTRPGGRRDDARGVDPTEEETDLPNVAPTVTPEPEIQPTDDDQPERPSGEVVVENPRPATDTVRVVETEAPPETSADPPALVETVADAVSSVAATLLSPFVADDTPATPAAQPQVWMLAAASRREFETAFESPAVTMEANVVENSLTYTPGPTFIDRIVLAIYQSYRVISDFTGVDVSSMLGKFLSTRTPPFFLTLGLDSHRSVWTAEDGTEWTVWQFSSGKPSGKTVVAFHGGGWIYQPNLLNWTDYTTMARQTGATVVVPLYPLATTPSGAATKVIPQAADFIEDQIVAHGAENVSLYGDSAGTVIAMSAVRELLLAGKPVPSSIVLLSTVTDSTLSNPDIQDINDPIFDVHNVQGVWESHWYDGITDRRDPLVSSLFFEPEVLKALPPTTIYVGEREILYPDTLLLHQRAVEEGAPISIVVGSGLVHDWAVSVAPLPTFSQTAAVRSDIFRQLGLIDDVNRQSTLTTEAAAADLAEVQAPQTVSATTTLKQPTLYNVIGSFFFRIFQAVEDFIVGAPQVPPGSTVRVERSTLEIDCGPGYTVDADWYFPDSAEPTRLIYLQHGFPGTAAEYDYTAAELAERNNAIVVVPTIPGNIFDCYNCQLGGDPMHAAVARLFMGDRAALLASARAAGFEGDALPQRFVLMGHSGGGQLAGGAAGYFERFAPDDEDPDLVGVILLDSSPIGGAIQRGLEWMPESIPVYTISAAPNFLNSKGGLNQALVQARPGQFVGVELVGGVHADSMRTHNPIVQFFGSLAGMGFSNRKNGEAVQVLAEGWINDFYEGTHTGVYGELGSTIDIPGTGGARAHVLPTPAPQLTIIDLIVDAMLRSTQLFAYSPCAVDPAAQDPSASVTAISTCGTDPTAA